VPFWRKDSKRGNYRGDGRIIWTVHVTNRYLILDEAQTPGEKEKEEIRGKEHQLS